MKTGIRIMCVTCDKELADFEVDTDDVGYKNFKFAYVNYECHGCFTRRQHAKRAEDLLKNWKGKMLHWTTRYRTDLDRQEQWWALNLWWHHIKKGKTMIEAAIEVRIPYRVLSKWEDYFFRNHP